MDHYEAVAIFGAPSTTTDTGEGGVDAALAAAKSRAGSALRAPPPRGFTTEGARIKHYEIVRFLGRGGTADVALARDTKLGRLVALKRPFRRDAASVNRLLWEARVLARLHHENAIVLYELNQAFGHPFLALEYIEGPTLRGLLGRLGPSAHVALRVMIPVVRALAHAHALGVMHLDLKPENIIVSERGTIKIVDFGSAEQRGGAAWICAPRPSRSKPWGRGGTLRYMSPEQLRADDVDGRADIWAVGVILHELCSGEHPLAPLKPGWYRRLLDRDDPFPGGVRRGASGPLADVIERCLSKHRDARFETAEALLSALEAISDAEGAGRWYRGDGPPGVMACY